MDIKPLLKEACRKIFGDAGGIVDMLIKHIPSSVKATASKVTHNYTGPLDTELAQHMKQCSPNGPLVVYACKLFPKPDCSAFDVYGRVMSGTVRPGERVRVLGEGYTPEDEEDSVLAEVTNVWLYQARYRLPLKKVGCCFWEKRGGGVMTLGAIETGFTCGVCVYVCVYVCVC